ncbi:hypothetical protein NSPZN2_11445 [Nitrospira defluvii]|uniref:Uncharacterized protein n=1 Tax=Nitrospira defluvii TaxID=330214 RepID=A0ABM8QUE0_9BACT|nr:hypothetical protein NSPZN2_11445 [Nitrospira defluvii]
MVQRCSGLHRSQVGGFQLVVPLGRGVGVVDQHQCRFVFQSHRLPLHCLFVLLHENIGEIPEQGLGEREPGKDVPGGGKIDPALLLPHRRHGGTRGDEHRSALHELKPLIGEDEVDGRRQRPAVEFVEELVRPAVFGRRVRHHPEPVGDGLEGLCLVVHAGLGSPPRALVDEGAVRGIHEPDDAVVDGTIQDRGDLDHAIGRGRQRKARQFRYRLIRPLRIGQIHPHVPVCFLARVGGDPDLLGSKRRSLDKGRNVTTATARIKLPSVIGALDPFSVEVTEGQGHASMRTNISHGRHCTLPVTAHENRLSQHDLGLHLADGQGLAGRGRIPETEQGGAFRRFEFRDEVCAHG